jgi:carbon monoxide dehydrogenase subunit G
VELVNDFTVNTPIDEAWAILTDLERVAPCCPGAQLEEVEGHVYRGSVKVKVGPITAQFKGEAQFVEQDAAAYRAVLRAKGRDTGGKGNADAKITAQLASVSPSITRVTVTTDLNITGKVAQFGRGALADVSTKLLGQFVDNLENTVLTQPAAAAATPKAKPKAATKAAPRATRPATPTEAPAAATEAPAATENPAAAEKTAPKKNSKSVPPDSGPIEAVHIEDGPPEVEAKPTIRKIEPRDVEPVDLLDAAGASIAKRIFPVVVVVVVLLMWRGRRRRRRRRAAARS